MIEPAKWALALSPNSHPKGIGWLLISSPQHIVRFNFQSTSREHHSCTTPGTRFYVAPSFQFPSTLYKFPTDFLNQKSVKVPS